MGQNPECSTAETLKQHVSLLCIIHKLFCFCFCADPTCELPTGTESDGTDCDYGEGGCTLSVLKAANMTCTSGYNGIPAKANAICGAALGTRSPVVPVFQSQSLIEQQSMAVIYSVYFCYNVHPPPNTRRPSVWVGDRKHPMLCAAVAVWYRARLRISRNVRGTM